MLSARKPIMTAQARMRPGEDFLRRRRAGSVASMISGVEVMVVMVGPSQARSDSSARISRSWKNATVARMRNRTRARALA